MSKWRNYYHINFSLKTIPVSNPLVNIKYCNYKNMTNYIKSIQGGVASDELLTQLIRPVS